MRELSRKAKRRGKIFCAPTCGLGCTLVEYQHATREAKKLARRLGAGWKPHVWENLGWHYSARSACGRWKVHPFIFRGKIHSYTAYLGEGDIGGRYAESGKTPERAIENTRKRARREVAEIASWLNMAANG